MSDELKMLRERLLASKRYQMDINNKTFRGILLSLILLLDKNIDGDYITIEGKTYFVDAVHNKFSECENSKED